MDSRLYHSAIIEVLHCSDPRMSLIGWPIDGGDQQVFNLSPRIGAMT